LQYGEMMSGMAVQEHDFSYQSGRCAKVVLAFQAARGVNVDALKHRGLVQVSGVAKSDLYQGDTPNRL